MPWLHGGGGALRRRAPPGGQTKEVGSRDGAKGAKLNERISYWLIPAEPEKSLFRQIITDLADRFDAPKFEPHVTLYSGPAVDGAPWEGIIVKAAAGTSEIVLRTSGLGHSEKFTKTLFVNYKLDEVAAKLSNELKRLSTAPEDY